MVRASLPLRVATVLAIGAALLAFAGLSFLSNVTRILRHLWRPETPIAAVPQAAAVRA